MSAAAWPCIDPVGRPQVAGTLRVPSAATAHGVVCLRLSAQNRVVHGS